MKYLLLGLPLQNKQRSFSLLKNLSLKGCLRSVKEDYSIKDNRRRHSEGSLRSNPRDITDIRPIAVQPGMALSVFGKNFRGKKLRVRIDNTELDEKSFRIIDENLLKIKIPSNETAGIKKLSLRSEDQEEDMLITFEVLPSETPKIRITEIRPNVGESGDLITIYGINFTDDVKVNIGGIDATSVTLLIELK